MKEIISFLSIQSRVFGGSVIREYGKDGMDNYWFGPLHYD